MFDGKFFPPLLLLATLVAPQDVPEQAPLSFTCEPSQTHASLQEGQNASVTLCCKVNDTASLCSWYWSNGEFEEPRSAAEFLPRGGGTDCSLMLFNLAPEDSQKRWVCEVYDKAGIYSVESDFGSVTFDEENVEEKPALFSNGVGLYEGLAIGAVAGGFLISALLFIVIPMCRESRSSEAKKLTMAMESEGSQMPKSRKRKKSKRDSSIVPPIISPPMSVKSSTESNGTLSSSLSLQQETPVRQSLGRTTRHQTTGATDALLSLSGRALNLSGTSLDLQAFRMLPTHSKLDNFSNHLQNSSSPPFGSSLTRASSKQKSSRTIRPVVPPPPPPKYASPPPPDAELKRQKPIPPPKPRAFQISA